MSKLQVEKKDTPYLEFDKEEYFKEINLCEFLDLKDKEIEIGQRPLRHGLFKYFENFGFYFLANGNGKSILKFIFFTKI